MENKMEVIDAHVHCGEGYSFKDYSKKIKGSSITGAVIFPLAFDIYQRINKRFKDSPAWREKRREANKYVLSRAYQPKLKLKIYPFKFMWNDFNREDLDRYFGVKLQRRSVDAEYKIGSPKFVALLDKLREGSMPIIFDDEITNTMRFISWAQGINIIIPHLGFGNMNYDELTNAGVWGRENIFTDTSNASGCIEVIKSHISKYGHERVLFGSDHPFCLSPKGELEKILNLDISDEAKEAITSKNILRLLEKKDNK